MKENGGSELARKYQRAIIGPWTHSFVGKLTYAGNTDYSSTASIDLLEIEQNEYNILTGFRPKQLGDEETKKICAELISKLGASSVKDMGKVMGELKKNHSDSIDFSKAGAILKEILNKQ